MDQKKTSPTNILFYTLCFSAFVVPIMVSAVGVALPSVGRDLGATALELGLVEQLYLLALAMTMLTFGRLGDLVGRGKIFTVGTIMFTLSAVGIGFAPNMRWFIVIRFIQGLSAALTSAVAMALVASLFPPEMRGRKLGFISGVIYAGISLGPLIGGFITTNLGWRFIFWGLGPLSVVTCIFSVMYMWKDVGDAQGEKLDLKGSVFYAVSIALIMLGASHGAEIRGWIMMGIGFIGLVAFCFLEVHTRMPLLDVGMMRRNRYFTFSLLAAMGNYASTFGLIFFMSLYLQYVTGLSPRTAGVILLLQPLMQMLLSPKFGKLADRMDPAKLTNIGVVIITVSLLCIAATLSMHTSVYLIAGELLFIGIGYGVFVVPNTLAIMTSVERKYYGVASSLVGTMRTLGMVISMTCATLMLSIFMGEHSVTPETLPTFLFTMRISLIIFAFFAVMGLLSSFARGKRQALSS